MRIMRGVSSRQYANQDETSSEVMGTSVKVDFSVTLRELLEAGLKQNTEHVLNFFSRFHINCADEHYNLALTSPLFILMLSSDSLKENSPLCGPCGRDEFQTEISILLRQSNEMLVKKVFQLVPPVGSFEILRGASAPRPKF